MKLYEDFISAPINEIDASLPSQGDAALVIFYVDFPHCSFSKLMLSWYDDSESESVDAGVEIIVEELTDCGYSITISPSSN